MKSKQRLSASVDAVLLEAADRAVRRGAAASVSAWVSDALRLKIAHDRRLEALEAYIREFEREHGEIGVEEMRGASRRARGRAQPVQGPRR